MGKPNLVSTQTRNANYIAGIKKRFASTAAIVIGGVSYKPADLETLLQKQIDLGNALTPAEAQYHAAVTAYRDVNAEVRPIALGFEQYVRLQFGDDEAALGDFGLKPRKRTPVKPAAKAAAAAKAKQTRALLGTKGKRQKKAAKAAAPTAAATATTPAPTTPAPTPTTPTTPALAPTPTTPAKT